MAQGTSRASWILTEGGVGCTAEHTHATREGRGTWLLIMYRLIERPSTSLST